jgi:transposase-like protein
MSLQPRRSFCKAIKAQGALPRTITLDGYTASHRAVCDMQAGGQLPTDTRLHSSKYLNNLIEQDHRGVKSRTQPILGFKNFESAAITIADVELFHRIHKNQFALSRLRIKGQTAPAIWNAVLAA